MIGLRAQFTLIVTGLCPEPLPRYTARITLRSVFEVYWSPETEGHMWERHQVTPNQANEAARDAAAVWYEPDPASKSGLTSRVVGYSHSREAVLCVILLPIAGDGYDGINAWPANTTYRRIYREGQ